MIDPSPALPTTARELLASLVGRRLLGVRRLGVEPAIEASLARDAGHGDLELELEGLRVSLVAEHERRSVLVAPTGLGDAAADVSGSAFWRWRLRREITGVRIWKSLDVPEAAQELEFGVELGLRGTRGVVVELVENDGVAGLAVSDGDGAERHRTLDVAGVVAPATARPGERAGGVRGRSPRRRR